MQSSLTGLIQCPDKESSVEGKLWPVFWPRGKQRSGLFAQLSPPQIEYMFNFYANADANRTNPDQIRVQHGVFISVFQIHDRQAIFQSRALLPSLLLENAKPKKPDEVYKMMCNKDGSPSPDKAGECMREYLKSLEKDAWQKISPKIMEADCKTSNRFQVQLSKLVHIPNLRKNPCRDEKNI